MEILSHLCHLWDNSISVYLKVNPTDFSETQSARINIFWTQWDLLSSKLAYDGIISIWYLRISRKAALSFQSIQWSKIKALYCISFWKAGLFGQYDQNYLNPIIFNLFTYFFCKWLNPKESQLDSSDIVERVNEETQNQNFFFHQCHHHHYPKKEIACTFKMLEKTKETAFSKMALWYVRSWRL